MAQETINKAEYIVIFISEFARRFSLSAVQAYRYLNRCFEFEPQEKA